MGLFGGKKSAPSINIPAPVKLPTAQELFQAATEFGQRTQPLAYGAREGALADLAKGTDYYNQFQPTSIEQALGNQYFQNIVPDLERSIKQNLSLSGMAYSPILAQQIAKARGQVGYDVGTYLANQGNTRATNSLNARLGIDPFNDVYGNYLKTDLNQTNAQADLQNQFNQAQALSDYQNALNKYNKQQQLYKTIGMLSPIGGAIYGGLSGGSEGFNSSASGSIDLLKMALPFLTSGISPFTGGFGGGGGAADVVKPSGSAMPVFQY